MKLHIASHLLVRDIQKEFNELFPFLKLEFFNRRALINDDYSAGNIVPASRKLGEIQPAIAEREIEFDGKMKVQDLEKLLKDECNLAVQVFRRSGNLWLETTLTDSWTLDLQNNHGREISTGVGYNTPVQDYDLNRDANH